MTAIDDLCTYCDQPAQEPDHVPPACVFPSPRPSNLITVLSCRACNLGYSKDDEYLKQVLAMRHDISEQPRAQPVVDSVFRALGRVEAQGYAAMVLRSLIEFPVRSPAGLHLGTAMAYHVNLHRVRRSLARTARALYRHECKVHQVLLEDVVPERSESEPTRIGRLKEVEIVVLELEERQDGRAGRPKTRPHSRVYNFTRHFCAIRNRH